MHFTPQNVKVEVNFGQTASAHPAPEGYQFIHNLPLEARVRSPLPPKEKSECTVMYLVGLPFSGGLLLLASCLSCFNDDVVSVFVHTMDFYGFVKLSSRHLSSFLDFLYPFWVPPIHLSITHYSFLLHHRLQARAPGLLLTCPRKKAKRRTTLC